jgi:hypothetical protein
VAPESVYQLLSTLYEVVAAVVIRCSGTYSSSKRYQHVATVCPIFRQTWHWGWVLMLEVFLLLLEPLREAPRERPRPRPRERGPWICRVKHHECIQLTRSDGFNTGDDSRVHRVVILIKSCEDVRHQLIISKRGAGGRHVVHERTHLAVELRNGELILLGCHKHNMLAPVTSRA